MKRIVFLMTVFICTSWGLAYADYTFTFSNSQYGVRGALKTKSNGDGTCTVTGGSVTGTGSSNNGIVYSLVSTQYGSANGRVQTDSNNNNVPLFKDVIGTNIDFDNLLMPGSSTVLDINGLLFVNSLGTSSEKDINIYANGVMSYQAFGDPGYYTVNGSVSAVPVPTVPVSSDWVVAVTVAAIMLYAIKGNRKCFRIIS